MVDAINIPVPPVKPQPAPHPGNGPIIVPARLQIEVDLAEKDRAAPPPLGVRQHLFDALWQEAVARISLLELTSPQLADQGFNSVAWDAARMPAGGHYYPIFIRLIEQLERAGRIAPDRSVLIETTTGTAGMALGRVAGALGYRIIVFMPEDMPIRRRAAVEAQLPPGSELRLTAAGTYVSGMVREFQRFLSQSRHHPRAMELFALDHSRRPEAVDALAEIVSLALIGCSQPVDLAVAALGNGTASSAMFRAVRSRFSKAYRVGVEPLEAPVAYLRKYGAEAFEAEFAVSARAGPHAMIGTGGWGVKFTNLDVDEIDRVIPVSESVWRRAQIEARSRGIDLGNSTAACQAALHAIASDSSRQVTAFSFRYDTTDLY